MRVKKSQTPNGSAAVLNHTSREDVVREILAQIPEIDAVFLSTDDKNVVHVFSVVKEFRSKIYDTLLKKERSIQKKLAGIALEFHVRAHQGREPAQAVPFEAQLVYAR